MAYFPYFRSQYDNRVDEFELVILGKDSAFIEQPIEATATLSYKDADNTLEPIRGAQLDIEIDANIDKPFDLFLDFREKDFKVTFFRNNILIFEGFVSPEGVAQDYTSINWKAKLTAFDNLGSLKNKEFKYNNELPSEFVFMDLCLKQTGLDLPIAFFDDINQEKKDSVVTIPYNATLENGVRERIIEPDVFVNDNGTFENCETILKDILQKYNVVLFMHDVRYWDASNEEFSNQLCWVFCRVALLKEPFTENIRPFKIKRVNDYVNDTTINAIFQKELLSPNIITIGTFSSPMSLLGTDGQTFLGQLDAIHKNKNQLLRQTRALQNFRFEQIWIEREDILNDFEFELFEYIGTVALENYFFAFNPSVLNQPLWKGRGSITTFTSFNPTVPLESQPQNAFVKLFTINIPDEASIYELSGSGNQVIQGSLTTTIVTSIQFMVVHTALNGDRFYLQSPPAGDNEAYTINQLFVTAESTFNSAFWIKDSEIQSDGLGNLTTHNVSNILFALQTNESSVGIDFNAELPPTITRGGQIDIYFSPLYVRNNLLDSVSQADADLVNFIMTDYNFKIVSPPEFGKGEYHDAKNLQDISTKVDKPVNVINADDKSNIFLNGLKRINENNEIVNYDFWTSRFNLNQDKENLLQLTSIERVRLLSKSQNIFSGDIHGYIPFFSRLGNTAYNNAFSMMFTKWVYDTADNTISAEAMENDIKQPSVEYKKTIIFEDEDKKLID